MNSKVRKLGRIEIKQGRGLHLSQDEPGLTSKRVFSTNELGETLRLRRRELGYTQETAAALCMHSPRAIGEIERGKKTASIGIIFDYAAILDIDVTVSVRGRS